MPLTTKQFEQGVGHHLRMISTSAGMIVQHARAMLARPDFDAMAMDELAMAEMALANALEQVRRAADIIREKPIDA